MRAFSLFAPPADMPDSARRTRRHMLARMGLAWLAMMQVMMFAFPGYLRSGDMSADNLASLDQAIYLMNWASLALTVPVIVYCAWPMWQGAWSSLRHGRIGMDVPVALGIVAAFVPSVASTWWGRGEVYFDSVTMFVAFLLTARYLELCARQMIATGKPQAMIEALRAAVSARSDRLAFRFVLAQIALTLIVGAVWFAIAPEHTLAVMVAMLVMSCPCAMSMAVPTAVAAAHAAVSVRAPQTDDDSLRLTQATAIACRQNLYGSVVWHLLMTPLAAIGLVAPWVAALTMLFSSLAVVGNSCRVYRRHVRAGGGEWRSAAAGAQP